jgi:ATP-dependent DNA ligase
MGRCLAFHAGGRVRLQSRHQRPLNRYFPEIAAAVATQLPEGTVVDGELVCWREGRLDFTALQPRLHSPRTAAPAHMVVFDVLADHGDDVRHLPYQARRERLSILLGAAEAPLALVPATVEPAGARAWLIEHVEAGIEGVVAKHIDHSYRSGRRGWHKIRTRLTAEAVVGGVVGDLDAPDALIVGRFDDRGRLRVAGRTGILSRAACTQLAAVLRLPSAPHPWPATLPSSRFGQLPSEPVFYTQVRPSLVVELDVDTAYEQHRWRHPARFRRLRPDLRLVDLRR